MNGDVWVGGYCPSHPVSEPCYSSCLRPDNEVCLAKPKENHKRTIMHACKLIVMQCSEGLSSFIPINLGLRQGCVLALTFFNTCMNWIMARATLQSYHGVTLCDNKVTDLDFVDDACCPVSRNPSGALDAYDEAQLLELELFWSKDKNFGGPDKRSRSVGTCLWRWH